MTKAKQTSLFDTIFIDEFAGGGGASTGIELATGHPIDVAINHDESGDKYAFVNRGIYKAYVAFR